MRSVVGMGTESAIDFAQICRELAAGLDTLEPELRAQTAAAVAASFEVPQASARAAGTRRVDRSLNEVDTFYAVHDGDLALLKATVSLAVSFVPFFRPATALPTLVALLFRYRRKRARIDVEQAAVLFCLRSAPPGGLTLSEVTTGLSCRTSLSEARVLEILHSLRGLPLEDGGRSDFVVESGDIWTAVDV